MLKKIIHNLKKLKRPTGEVKHVLIESKHPAHPPKKVPEHLIHESVFEPNHPHDAPSHYAFEKAVFSWIAPEYHQHPKSARWWTIFVILAFVALILEALSGNWTMLLATLVFIAVYFSSHEYFPPKHVKIVISEYGFKIGFRKIPFSEISSFAILYQPPHLKRLIFRLKRSVFSDLIIEMEEEDPAEIRKFLGKHLKEIENVKETYADFILRILKF